MEHVGKLLSDGEVIIAEILHDTVEDTDLDFGCLGLVQFDRTAANPTLAKPSREEIREQNLQHTITVMIRDTWVLVLMLCDRVRNMSTVSTTT
ncbi:unnamed protein product [Discosporangium mesarthrocarpum]